MEMFIYEVDGDRSNIYITEFDDVKELNDKLADFICSFKDQKDPNTNINSFQTPWLIGSPETEIILSKVMDMLNTSKALSPNKEWKLWNMFGNVYKTGQSNNIHAHPANEFSFNYFVKCPPNSAPLVLTTSGEEIEAVEGKLVVFSGHLKHHVPISNHEGKRITLAGNIRRIN